ncbi:unnamed protein product, partial [Brenthis ino]
MMLANKPEDNIFLNSNNAKMLLNLPPLLPKTARTKSTDSSCYCKNNQMPCKCACKQCLMISPYPFSSTQLIRNAKNKKKGDIDDLRLQNFKHAMDKSQNVLGSNLNIVIKIDFQLPNTSDGLYKQIVQDGEQDEVMPNEYMSTINLPFPYLNIPTPTDLAKYKGTPLDYASAPMHKIIIHKKKKSRTNNNSKRHKSKKVITFHSYKNDAQVKETDKMIFNNEALKNYTIYNKNSTVKVPENILPSANFSTNNVNISSTIELSNINATITYEPMNINNNISENNNSTRRIHNNENSIEIDSENNNAVTASSSIRLKRDASASATIGLRNESRLNTMKETRKYDKMSDNELLYWPDNNNNNSKIPSKNITALILDKETKKAKINLSHDKIQNTNRTLVLERAIFGDVDWDDTDSVVPIFMSFVGKYIRGILTFCSEKVCHSMKCAKKLCIHRICTPDLRYNNNGHCMGNNYTDSVATMESVMDLPSNITFEVVDILQDKMLGNLYGKIANEFYLSPWNTINITPLKIIDFETSGDIKVHSVPLEQFINLKKFSQDFNTHNKIRNLTPSINDEKDFLQRMVYSMGRKKIMKILTICDKNIELYNVIEGRGIGSTIWGWITYPFSWWRSDIGEIPPESDQLIGSTPINSLGDIEISKRNVTIWCNDQTCTTMRCERFGCVNVTCNIYDTDLIGECRNYNTAIIPEEPITIEHPDAATKPLSEDKGNEIIPKPPIVIPTTVPSIDDLSSTIEEHPLELEAVLSSTVSEKPDKEKPSELSNME